jgi:hypothetical protein
VVLSREPCAVGPLSQSREKARPDPRHPPAATLTGDALCRVSHLFNPAAGAPPLTGNASRIRLPSGQHDCHGAATGVTASVVLRR